MAENGRLPWRIPLVDLRAQHAGLAHEIEPAIRSVIDAQAFILGEPVARFEQTLARLCGTKHAVGVASGTDALTLSLIALGIGAGDAVLTTAFSFVATADAIVRAGACPIFADIQGFNVDPSSVERRIERMHSRADGARIDPRSGARLRAIVPVHLFGQLAPMTELSAMAARWGLAVVEDAAQAMGAASPQGAAGSLGDAGAISFFPSKNLGAWGDGGAVVTSSDRVADRVRLLRAHGGPSHAVLGMNSRLDALQAAVLEVKARHLDAWVRARGQAADRYRALLAPLGDDVVLPPVARAGERHGYNQFVLRVPRREALRAHLAAAGIQSRAYYSQPLHKVGALRPWVASDERHEVAEETAGRALGIPLYPEIGVAAQEEIAARIAAFYR